MPKQNDLPTPVTANQKFLAKAAGMDVELPTAVTMDQMYLQAIAEGSGGGSVDAYTKAQTDALLADKADLVNGVVPISQIPPAAIEKEVPVANDAARFALTTADVQLGDTVRVVATNKMYLVVDVAHLDTEAGYQVYVAGRAAEAVADQYGNTIDTTYATKATTANLQAQIDELSEITESGNLVLGKIKNSGVNGIGAIVSDAKSDLWYAKIEQGQVYAITTDESRIVIGYFNDLPRFGLTSYNKQRLITEKGIYTITAPITGYIAFRSLTGYEYAQIEKGTTKTQYLDVTVASDIAMFENIGFCGDSYMAGMIVLSENPTVTAHNQNLCWGKILERTHGINASIFAKGGVKASDYINDTDCLPALLKASAQQLYVISLGHNDAYYQTSVSSFKDSYESILDSIVEHAPNAKIILCRQSRGYGDLNNGPELNEAISAIGMSYGIPVLNPENDIYLSSSIYTDTMVHSHPTFAGYAGMAKAFDRQFAKATVDYANYFKDYTGLSE